MLFGNGPCQNSREQKEKVLWERSAPGVPCGAVQGEVDPFPGDNGDPVGVGLWGREREFCVHFLSAPQGSQTPAWASELSLSRTETGLKAPERKDYS